MALAPSVLVGPSAFIKRARWFRKMFGGGIRQSGAIAAAADVALTQTFPRLYSTHLLARKLADGFVALGGELLNPTETNMVWLDFRSVGIPIATLMERAQQIKPYPLVVRGSRFVIHHQIDEQAIDDLLQLVAELKEEMAVNGTGGREVTSINENRPQEKVVRSGY